MKDLVNRKHHLMAALAMVLVALMVLGLGMTNMSFAADPDGAGEQKGSLADVGSEKTESEIEGFALGQPSDHNLPDSATQMELNDSYYAIYDKDVNGKALTYRKQPFKIKVTVKMAEKGDNHSRNQVLHDNVIYITKKDAQDNWVYYNATAGTDSTPVYYDSNWDDITNTVDTDSLVDANIVDDESRDDDPLYYTRVYKSTAGLLSVDWRNAWNTKVEWTIETLDMDGNPFKTNLATGIMDPDESNYLFPATARGLYYVSADDYSSENKKFAETFYVYENGIYPMVMKEGELTNQAVGFDEGKILVGMEGESAFNFNTQTFRGGYLAAPFLFKITFKATYVSDNGGSITGITDEELDDGDNPSGSSEKTKDGYKFTGWTADKDVTLEDGTTIPAGTVLTEEQIKKVVMDKDITFTAHHELIPKLAMTKTVDAEECAVGDTVTYTVTLSQTVSGAKARDVVVTDIIDPELSIDMDSFSDNVKAYNITADPDGKTGYRFTIPELTDSITWTYNATVNEAGDNLKNVVTATSPDTEDADSDTDPGVTSTETLKSYDTDPFIIKKADVSTAMVGDIITYTVIIGNNEPRAPLKNAQVTDALPTGLKYVKDSITVSDKKATATAKNNKITVEVDELEDDIVITYQAKVTKDADDTIENVATLDGDNFAGTSATRTVDLEAAEEEEETPVKTGDNANIWMYYLTALTGMLCLAWTMRKRGEL